MTKFKEAKREMKGVDGMRQITLASFERMLDKVLHDTGDFPDTFFFEMKKKIRIKHFINAYKNFKLIYYANEKEFEQVEETRDEIIFKSSDESMIKINKTITIYSELDEKFATEIMKYVNKAKARTIFVLRSLLDYVFKEDTHFSKLYARSVAFNLLEENSKIITKYVRIHSKYFFDDFDKEKFLSLVDKVYVELTDISEFI